MDGHIRNVTLEGFSQPFRKPYPETLLWPTKIADLNEASRVAILMQLEEDDDIIALALHLNDQSYLFTHGDACFSLVRKEQVLMLVS